MRSHAANPTAVPLDGDLVRVYFSTRDDAQRSSVGSVDLDMVRRRSVAVAARPWVTPGDLGLFDDSGISIGCVVSHAKGLFLYYIGWNLCVTVPWRNSIGLAVAPTGDDVFRKVSRAPILDRSDADPYSLSYPWVTCERETWRMWYGSFLTWGREQHDMRVVLKYAESSDGVGWTRNDVVAFPLVEGEWGVSRPCVLQEGDLFRMWYSSRTDAGYRIGYAESEDGLRWERRDDEAGIEPSVSGWDSEMVEYACVFDHKGERYMLYNGNGFGRTGFGLAVLER